MKISSLLMLVLFACPEVSLGQIGAKTQTSKVQGTWHNNDFGYQMTLMLNNNGTGEFDGEAIQYSVEGTQLKIKQEGVMNTYGFALAGNTLTLSGGDLDAPIKFTRSGSSPTSTTSSNTVASKSTGSANSSVVGTWSNYGESIEFKGNGQCIYGGQVYPYSISGNTITLNTAQGNLPMNYSLSGNQLTLVVNQQTLVYTRGANTNNSAGAVAATPSGGKRIDTSLVGKWCWTNVNSTNSGGSSSEACITINADGTYEYYSERSMSVNTNAYSGGTSSQGSDRGTWWVEGNRIFYNSQSSGQGSYQLEKRNHPKNNDPMIVLDGDTYVTYYQKAPW